MLGVLLVFGLIRRFIFKTIAHSYAVVQLLILLCVVLAASFLGFVFGGISELTENLVSCGVPVLMFIHFVLKIKKNNREGFCGVGWLWACSVVAAGSCPQGGKLAVSEKNGKGLS